jgi:rod shape-determining protein MreD
MKRILFFFLTGLFLMSLQATFLSYPPVQGVRPDLTLVLVLYLGFSLPLFSGGMLAFLMGFLMDLFSGNVLGFYTLTRPLAFFVAQLFRHRFYWQGSSFQFLFMTLASLLEGLFLMLLLIALTPSPLENLYPSVFTHLLPQALCTGLVTPPLFALLRKGTEILQKKEERRGIRLQG